MTKPRKPQLAYIYRVRQFGAALLGSVSPADMSEANSVLGPELYRLFAGLPGQYRHHLLAVYHRVKAAGCDDPDVLAAALLHDSGKYDPASGYYVSLPYRVSIVLLEWARPGRTLLRRLAHARGSLPAPGWRYPFYLSRHHAELGAALIAGRGASRNVVRLVAEHHRSGHNDGRLLALQAADDKS